MESIKKIKSKENALQKLENLFVSNYIQPSKLTMSTTIKFSYSNEKELLFSSRNKEGLSPLSQKKQTIVILPKKIRNKSKSEEKFTNSPNYQIFIAKNPEIKNNILKFIDKKFQNKLNVQTNSPIASFEEICDKNTNSINENNDDYTIKISSPKPNKKKTKFFKEDDKSFAFSFQNPSLYYLGPVLEEKKEDVSSSDSSSSSSSSSNNDSDKSKEKNETSYSNLSKSTIKKLKKHNKHKKKSKEEIENDNFDENEEEMSSLKKGYMSDENDINPTIMKRAT